MIFERVLPFTLQSYYVCFYLGFFYIIEPTVLLKYRTETNYQNKS